MSEYNLRLYAPFAYEVLDATADIISNRDKAQQVAPTEFLENDKLAEAKNIAAFTQKVEAMRARHYAVVRHAGSVTMMPHVQQQHAAPNVYPAFFRSRDSMLWFSRFDYDGVDTYGNVLMATHVHIQTPDLNGEPPLDLKILEISKQGDNDEQPAMQLHECTATSYNRLEETAEHLAEIVIQEAQVIHDAATTLERPQLYLVK